MTPTKDAAVEVTQAMIEAQLKACEDAAANTLWSFSPLLKGLADLIRTYFASTPDVSRAEMVAFGASDAACYYYPEEHQQELRDAFCEGAAHAVSTPDVSRGFGDVKERASRFISLMWPQLSLLLQRNMQTEYDAILSALSTPSAAGASSYVLVPREPTEAMCGEGANFIHGPLEGAIKDAASVWSAMLEAAPTPSPAGTAEREADLAQALEEIADASWPGEDAVARIQAFARRILLPAPPADDRVCQICDGGPGNHGSCLCGFKKYTRVSEGMIDKALAATVPGGASVMAWLPMADGWTPHQTARDVMRSALAAVLDGDAA